MNLAYFDIETNDLNGSFGRILCASVLLLPSEEMVTLRLDDYIKRKTAKNMRDDKKIAEDLRDLLDQQHMTLGWYSKGFDIPFLNTRLVSHESKRLETKLHLDGVWYAKGWRGIKPKSASLESVAEFFGLDERKMKVEPDVWEDARVGEREAMDVIVDRCESDVRLTREVMERLLDNNLVSNIQRYP